MFYSGLTREQLLKIILISYIRDAIGVLKALADYAVAVGIILLTAAEDAAFYISMAARKAADWAGDARDDFAAWMEDVAAPAMRRAAGWLQARVKGAWRLSKMAADEIIGLLLCVAVTGLRVAIWAKGKAKAAGRTVADGLAMRSALIAEWKED